MFGIMRDAESPRTVFDMMYTRLAQLPDYFQLDNGCNFHSFILHRELEHFSAMRVLVDEPHFRGHKNCSDNYNTGVAGPDVCLMSALILFDMAAWVQAFANRY